MDVATRRGIGPTGPSYELRACGTSRASSRANAQDPKDGLTYVYNCAEPVRMSCSPADSECDSDQEPAHEVTITRAFCLGQTPVTRGAYRRVAGSNLIYFQVTWNDAQGYSKGARNAAADHTMASWMRSCGIRTIAKARLTTWDRSNRTLRTVRLAGERVGVADCYRHNAQASCRRSHRPSSGYRVIRGAARPWFNLTNDVGDIGFTPRNCLIAFRVLNGTRGV